MANFTTHIAEEKHIEEAYKKLSIDLLEEKLSKHFLGEYWQAPHSFSASKFEGKRLYEHAVKGRMIQKEKVKREILEFKVINYTYPELEFVVTVSSGTYVRSLFEEIAELLGGLGALQILERVAIGENTSEKAMKTADWPKKGESFDLEKWGTPLDQVLRLNKVILDPVQTPKYLRGQRFPLEQIKIVYDSDQEMVSTTELFWSYDEAGHFLGLGRPFEGELQVLFNLQQAIDLLL